VRSRRGRGGGGVGGEFGGKASFVELIIFIYQKSPELRGTEIQREVGRKLWHCCHNTNIKLSIACSGVYVFMDRG